MPLWIPDEIVISKNVIYKIRKIIPIYDCPYNINNFYGMTMITHKNIIKEK